MKPSCIYFVKYCGVKYIHFLSQFYGENILASLMVALYFTIGALIFSVHLQ